MKAQAAIWVDNVIRYREEGDKPRRSIKPALTCGEETKPALERCGLADEGCARGHRRRIGAIEGVDGDLDAKGRTRSRWKVWRQEDVEDLRREVRTRRRQFTPGRGATRFIDLARDGRRVSRYEFPVQLDDVNRG